MPTTTHASHAAMIAAAPDWVPDDLKPLFEQVMRKLPAFPDRQTAASVWSDNVHEMSHRTLEAAPLPTRILNGRACFTAREFVEWGFRRVLESPAVRGGRRAHSEKQAA
jgi:hypothetical protein